MPLQIDTLATVCRTTAARPSEYDQVALTRVEIVRTAWQMERHITAWRDLFQHSLYRSVGGEPDFCVNWFEHFGIDKNWAPNDSMRHKPARPARPFFVMGWRDGRLDALLPLRIVPTRAAYMHGQPYPQWLGRFPTQSLQGFVNAHSLITGILVRDGSGCFASDMIRRVVSSLRWQTIDLGLIPDDDDLGHVIRSALRGVAIAMPDELFRDHRVAFNGCYNDFVAARASLRKNNHQTCKKLESTFGTAELRRWSGHDAVKWGFPAFLEVDGQSWKAMERGGESLNDHADIRDYYANLIARFAASGRAHVFGFFLGGNLAAAMLCLESDNMLYIYKTSYKEAYAAAPRCRPGAGMLKLFVEQNWDRFRGVDFMSQTYPEEWRSDKIVFSRKRYVAASRWHRLAFPVVGR